MIVAGESLYTLEVQPAANAALAANEAEKAARIKVLEIVSFGSLGRVYLAGKDRDIDVAWPAAEDALKQLEGARASEAPSRGTRVMSVHMEAVRWLKHWE